MATVIRMPRLSDTMEEGNIVEWLKEEGDSVEPGDLLAEVETDKATMELDAYDEGVLLHIAVKEGAIPIGGVIAVIGQEGEDWQAAIDAAKAEGGDSNEAPAAEAPAAAPEPEPTPEPEPEPQPQAAAPQPQATEAPQQATAPRYHRDEETVLEAPAAPSANGQRVKASPLARSMAKDRGIDLSTVQGSGDNGRITKRDIENYKDNGAAKAAPQPQAQPQRSTQAARPVMSGISAEDFEDMPVSQMRKVIARRLSESKFSAPHFYLVVEVDMTKAIESRKQLNAIAPVKISFNDLVVKSVAASLKQHPAVNSSWMGDNIRRNKQVHIGVAVAVEDGLVVPVVRNADQKTLSAINTEVKDYAGRARERKLQPDEMTGSTFSISNLGMFGIEQFTAIVNPPNACILAVGAIVEKPVVRDGAVVVGNTMKLSLSCDHRVVDGATGAEFLKTLKGMLEDPIRMLV